MIFLLPIVFAILNALRGAGKLNRLLCVVVMAVAIDAYAWLLGAQLSVLFDLFVITAAMLESGFVLGWGKYLNVAFPKMQYVAESEVPPIDWVADKICGIPKTAAQFSYWCFIAFAFRSMLFYPIFWALSFYNPHAYYWGLGVLSMPIIYWLRRFTKESYSVRAAELTFGAILGALISITLTGF